MVAWPNSPALAWARPPACDSPISPPMKTARLLFLGLVALGSPFSTLDLVSTALAQATKPEISARIDATKKTYEDIALKIWGYAETGYHETQSSGLLQATLRDAGFNVQPGVAEMPTAFVATYGSGSPVI